MDGDTMRPDWICRRTSARLAAKCCPERKQNTHKGDYGKILLLCGAEGYTGAPSLAAKAALRSGAGLIYLGVPQTVYPIVASKLDEPIVFPLADRDGKLSLQALDEIFMRLPAMDACLLGPGLGRSADLDLLVQQIVRKSTCPLILDADGINAIAGHIDVLREAACPVVLTPHEGEFRRLTRNEERDRIGGAISLAQTTGCIVVRKGHVSIITDGEKTYVNHTGNAGLATGGSGDVLAGIMAALLGQKCVPLEAAAAAVWLHGTAADLAAADMGQYALTPSDVIGRLSRLLP